MKHTIIENTDIRVSRIAFGTASLHHLFFSSRRQNVLEAAASAGITHFDTSPYYGYGLAESSLGTFLKGRRAQFTVTTKMGLYPFGPYSTRAGSVWVRKALGKLIPKISLPDIDWQVARGRDSLYESLKRLKTDYIDFVFLHEPDRKTIQAEAFMRMLESEHARGTVRCWGIAGVPEHVKPWVLENHPLAGVVQTRDSLDEKQADFMTNCGRSFQFTYGYLSARKKDLPSDPPAVILQKALQRNEKGAIIVSTRRAERIALLAGAVT